jgi:hypothetical protein
LGEKKYRRTCLKCGQRCHYIGDAECKQAAKSMTDAINALYRSSGGDQSVSSTILFEITVSIDVQTRESTIPSSVAVNNYFDHLVDEYEGSCDSTTYSSKDETLDSCHPSLE